MFRPSYRYRKPHNNTIKQYLTIIIMLISSTVRVICDCMVRVIDTEWPDPQGCCLKCRKIFCILSYEEIIQQAYGTSVVLPRYQPVPKIVLHGETHDILLHHCRLEQVPYDINSVSTSKTQQIIQTFICPIYISIQHLCINHLTIIKRHISLWCILLRHLGLKHRNTFHIPDTASIKCKKETFR